jgi:hypothetical protein
MFHQGQQKPMLPIGMSRFMVVDGKLNEWRLSSLSFESGWTASPELVVFRKRTLGRHTRSTGVCQEQTSCDQLKEPIAA